MKKPNAAEKAWKTRRDRESQRGDLFSIEKQDAIKAKIEKEKRRDVAITAGPDAYQEFLREETKQGREEKPERVLIIVPPRLLYTFQQFCNTESYSFVEGVREAMRRMLSDMEFETPADQASGFKVMMEGFTAAAEEQQKRLQKIQDPSTLPSQRNTL